MKKTKLILAMYIGVVTLAVASVSMSVAWFFASRTLYVSGINITFDTEKDLKISESRDEKYVDRIDHNDKDANGFFMPLTSAHSSLWTSQRKDSPIFYDESGCSEIEDYVSYRAVDEGYGYFTKKFYLLADDDVYVTISADKTKTYIEKNEVYNEPFAKGKAHDLKLLKNNYDQLEEAYLNLKEQYEQDPSSVNPSDLAHAKSEFDLADKELETYLERHRYCTKEELSQDEDALYKTILNRLNKVVNAMRFSILIKDGDEYQYAIIDPNKDGVTLLGGILDNSVDQYYDYYLDDSTNELYERVYGEFVIEEGKEGKPVYPEKYDKPETFKDPELPSSAFNSRHKKGVWTFDAIASEGNGFKIAEENSLALSDFEGTPKFHFPVRDGVPKEVIISLYLEGWDLDSVNYTMEATFNAALSFKIEREM